jgi:transcriptional regulator PpsR
LKNTVELPDRFKLIESLVLGLADLVVVLNPQTHQVVSVKTKGLELSRLKLEGWVGERLSDWTELDSTEKYLSLLKEPTHLDGFEAKGADFQWRHINFLSPSKASTPFLVHFFEFQETEHLIMVGRDLGSMSKMQQKLMDAHRSMERDYLRLRHTESRYKLLFESSSEAILIVDLASRKITQANASAAAVFALEDAKKLIDEEFSALFSDEDRTQIETLLSSAQTTGKTQKITAKLNALSQPLSIMPALIVQEGGAQLLVRLGAKGLVSPLMSDQPLQACYTDALQKAPYGFVVTDASGLILSANEEFMTMTGAISSAQVLGHPLESWLARGGVDWGVLSNNLKQLSSLRNFATELVSQSQMTLEVEISASKLTSDEKRYGFFIRDVHRLSQTGPVSSSSMAGSVSQLSQLVGRMPMKEIVGETTDMIEKMCIESALELTQNNRASAAEMLGLSRQSLYIKLHRYGIAESNDKG